MNIKEEREALFSSQHDVTGLWTAHRFSLWIFCPCRQEDVALDPSLCHLLDTTLIQHRRYRPIDFSSQGKNIMALSAIHFLSLHDTID